MQGHPEEHMWQHSGPTPVVLPCYLYLRGGNMLPGIVVVGSTIRTYVYKDTEWTLVTEDDEYALAWPNQ